MPAKITFGQAAGYTKHMIKELFEEGKIDLPPSLTKKIAENNLSSAIFYFVSL